MRTLLVGMDLGTAALKTAVFDEQGRELASASHEYALETPAFNMVESHPDIYIDAIVSVFRTLSDHCGIDLSRIAAIGFSSQSETLVFVDENGKPLRNAISWMDGRAGPQARSLRETFGDDLCYRVTGQVGFAPNWPAPKVLWVRENEPDVFAGTAKILCLADYVIHWLTGRYVADCSLLTSTQYWDITTRKYWPEMLDRLGVSAGMLPEILESGEVAGKILPRAARELGINPDALICTGGMDNAVGAIGVGTTRTGMFYESTGSSQAVCVPLDEITYDPNRVIPVHYSPIRDRYMLHTFTTGGLCMRWFRDNFCQLEKDYAELSGADNYDLLIREADTVPPGAGGLVFLPHLNGAMAPDSNPNALGVFFGMTVAHRKPHFIRAIMESLGYLNRRNIDALANMGVAVDEVRAFGGGSKSALWCQIKADILKRPVCVTNSRDTAPCLGAAALAGHAIGLFSSVQSACDSMVHVTGRFEPNPAHADVYDRGYEKYKKLQADLIDMFDYVAEDRARAAPNGASSSQRRIGKMTGNNMSYDYAALLKTAGEIVAEAGEIFLRGYGSPGAVRHKGRTDLVTDTDVAVEKFLKRRLAELTPDAALLAEESAESLEIPDTCWIIDPIDGTTNFTHGWPLTAISVAFHAGGEIRLGIVMLPVLGETYLARRGGGATLNGVPLRVSAVRDLDDALVTTGFPYDIEDRMDELMPCYRAVQRRAQAIRQSGTSAVDLAWLAAGRNDVYFEKHVKPWDVAAGICIVREAGGEVTKYDGTPFTFDSRQILATNGAVHRDMIQILK